MILFGSDYWGGLLDWMRTKMQGGGKIAPADLNLLHLTDTPKEVCQLICRCVAGHPRQKAKEAAAREVTRRAFHPDRTG